MSSLNWSIPVEQYTPAHWAVIDQQERAKEARKAAYDDMEDEQDRQERREFYKDMGFDYDSLRQGTLKRIKPAC